MFSGAASALAKDLARGAKNRTFRARRTLEAGADLRQAQTQFCHGPAQRVAVHAELFGSFALVATVRYQHFA
jgi:hypothetical protein